MAEAESNRFIPMGSSVNFRHLGGYEATGGRMTRGDRLFRSGWFELANEDDTHLFESLCIRTAFDFRTEAERKRKPLRLERTPKVRHVFLDISSGSMGEYLQRIRHLRPEEIDCRAEMTRMYEAMLTEATPRLRDLMAILLESPDPVLLFCSTGKDRTGVASAMLLAALGVPKATIFSDYMLSADAYAGQELQFARNHGLENLGHEVEVFKDIFTVHPEYLEGVWSCMERMSGTIEGFLAEHLELSREALDHLRDQYMSPLHR
jgi:protein-tyrosine phosphatase